MRWRVSISPLSWTVVCSSSRNSTAIGSFEYTGSFSCARARSQSGAESAASARETKQKSPKAATHAINNAPLIVLRRGSTLEQYLSIVICPRGAEEAAQSRVGLFWKSNAADHKVPCDFHGALLFRGGYLINHRAHIDFLRRRQSLDFVSRRRMDHEVIYRLVG